VGQCSDGFFQYICSAQLIAVEVCEIETFFEKIEYQIWEEEIPVSGILLFIIQSSVPDNVQTLFNIRYGFYLKFIIIYP
jgi:hypothetical protein